MNRVTLSLLVSLVVTAFLGSACAFDVPAMVDGHVQGSAFSIRDDFPVVRPQHDGQQLVVLGDHSDGELRLVQIRLPADSALPLDEPVAVGGAGLEVTASFGTLESELRSDGVRVVSSSDATEVAALGGSVTLASLAPVLAGTFEVTLEDGGSLTGEFIIER